jgi:succinoglycan biosynthesis transport protein ExoP
VTQERDQELDLQHVVAVLWKRWWVIAIFVTVAAITSFAFSSRSPDRYQATAVVRVTSPNANRLFTSAQQNAVDPKRLVDTETQVLLANDVRLTVEDQLGDRRSQVGSVAVANPVGTDLLEVTVTSTSPQLARDAANAYAEVYVANRREENVSDLAQRAQELRAQAHQLDQQMGALDAADPRRVQMQTSQNSFLTLATQYEAEAGLLKSNVQIVDRAQQPNQRVSPQPLRDTGVAAVLALVLGLGLVFLLDRLDDRITGPDDLEELLPAVPLLGSVPIYDPEKKRGTTKLPHGERTLVPLNSIESEVYRTLRSNVRFSGLGRSKTILMITSASGTEGKSTVTSNLAVSLAESGQRVVLVSADLRRPALSQFFGIEETKKGLTTVLLGDSPVSDCLVPVTIESGHRLYVLPTGPLPPNPAELLGSRTMGDLLQGLAGADVDFVLIDCPPVLPVADPLAIAQFADGVVLVSVVGQTRAHHLVEACERLERVGSDVVGIVLNGVPTGRGRYPYYYYRRYGRYGDYSQRTDMGKDRSDGNGSDPHSSLPAPPATASSAR